LNRGRRLVIPAQPGISAKPKLDARFGGLDGGISASPNRLDEQDASGKSR
jgi:hypothetical protein